jgi:hypothetical protein
MKKWLLIGVGALVGLILLGLERVEQCDHGACEPAGVPTTGTR